MRNENSLKARVQRDAEFFKHLLADVPARQVLAMAQQKYPEASMYEERTGRIYFAANTDGWFRWVSWSAGRSCSAPYISPARRMTSNEDHH